VTFGPLNLVLSLEWSTGILCLNAFEHWLLPHD
jgi:hypothetical protein